MSKGKATVRSNGLDKSFSRIVGESQKLQKEVLLAMALPMAEQLEKNTPISDVDKDSYTHMKDDVHFSYSSVEGTARVGYGKKTSWKAHMLENGTEKMQGQHVVERTLQQNQAASMEIGRKLIKQRLGL